MILCVAMIVISCLCLASCRDDGDDAEDAPAADNGGDVPGDGTSDGVLPDAGLGDDFKGGLDPEAWT